ncbi:MAG: hypothetical protein AAGI89_13320 [Pseudomonadota bacterium]
MLRTLFVALALVATASAQADVMTRTPRKVMDDVNQQTVSKVVRNAGFIVEQATISGADSLVVRDGVTAVIMRPRVCDPNCSGLLMYAVIDGVAPPMAINGFNEQTPATSAFTSEGYTILSRYLIADYGITEGSFLTNLAVFQSTVEKWLGQPGGSGPSALSVSLGAPVPQASEDLELRAYLDAVKARPELLSRNLGESR